MGPRVDLIDFLTEMIDLRSFSNLWYWIGLAVLWSSASHWVLGVPFDLIARAGRKGGQVAIDLELAVGVQVRRALHIAESAGNFLIAFVFFVLTVLVLLGFVYGVEFAQAVFLMMCPMSLVGAMNLRTARQIVGLDLSGDALRKLLLRTRLKIQMLGSISIFLTACWGMYQNLLTGAL
ncbi:hypothetical protein TRM7557_03822 [Tritonibacter multivorans]|uniref:Component of SufBCD complex n=1 Tax=Tritonibacter multivorans TaxID=928856 RepID=A0A0P1GKL2_9RHOB|nr:hypothetical protein TRM7557_03822 [Tritonibacter multivorans]SFC96560.1 hypothetical protein SAMN04488049_105168 [Tritonibacter multivorans]